MGNAGCCNDLITTKCFTGDSLHWKANFDNDTTSIGKLYDYVNNRVDIVVTGEDFRTFKSVASEYKVYSGKEVIIPKLNNHKDWMTNVYVFGRDPSSLKSNGLTFTTSKLQDSGYLGFLGAPCHITSNEFFVAVAFTGNQGTVNGNISGVIPQSHGTIYSGTYDGGDKLSNGERYNIAVNYSSGKDKFGDSINSSLDIHNRYATYSADKGSVIDQTFSSAVSLVQMSNIKHVFGIRNESGLYVFIDNGTSIVRLKDNLIEGYLCYNSTGRQSYLFNPNDQSINIISYNYPVGYNVTRDSSGYPQRFSGPRLSPQESGYRYISNDNYDYINGSISVITNNSTGERKLEWGSGLIPSIPFGPWDATYNSGVMANKNKVGSCIAYSSGNTGYAVKDRLTLPIYKDYAARGTFASENNAVYSINPFSFAIKNSIQLPTIDTTYAYAQAPTDGILKTPEVLGFVKDAPLYSGYLSHLNDNINPKYKDNIAVDGGFDVFYDDAVINHATENQTELIVIQPYVDSFVENELETQVSTVVKNKITTDEIIKYNSYTYDFDYEKVNSDVASGLSFARKLTDTTSQINGLHVNDDKIYVTYSNTFSFSYYSKRIFNNLVTQVNMGDKGVRSLKKLFQYEVIANSGYQVQDVNEWYRASFDAAGADFDEAIKYGYTHKYDIYTTYMPAPQVSWINKLGMTGVKDVVYGKHTEQHAIVPATDGQTDLSTTFSISIPGAKCLGGVITPFLWGLGFTNTWKNKTNWMHDAGDGSIVKGYADLSFEFVKENYPIGVGYHFAVGLTDSTLPEWSASEEMYIGYSLYTQTSISPLLVEPKYPKGLPLGTATAPYFTYNPGSLTRNGYYPALGEPDVVQTYLPNSYKAVQYPQNGIITGFSNHGYSDIFHNFNTGIDSGICDIAAPVIQNGYWGGVRTLYGSPDENVSYFNIAWGKTVADLFSNQSLGNTHPNGWYYTSSLQFAFVEYFGTRALPVNLNIVPTDWANIIGGGKDHMFPTAVSITGGPASVPFPYQIPSIQIGINGDYYNSYLQYGFLNGVQVETQRWNLKAKDYMPLNLSVGGNFIFGSSFIVDETPEAKALADMAPWLTVQKVYGNNNIARSCATQWYYDAMAVVVEERVATYDRNYKLLKDEAVSSKYNVVYPSYGPTDNIANFYMSHSSDVVPIPQYIMSNPQNQPLPQIPPSGSRTFNTNEVVRNPSGVVPPFYAARFESFAITNNTDTGYIPVNLTGSISTDKSMAISDKTAFIDMTPVLERYNTLSTQVSGVFTMELQNSPPYPSFLVNSKEKYYYPNGWVQPADSGVAYLINKDIGQWLPSTTDIRAYSVKNSSVPTVRYITDVAVQIPASGFAANTELQLNVAVTINASTLTPFSGYLTYGLPVSFDGSNYVHLTYVGSSGTYFPYTSSGTLEIAQGQKGTYVDLTKYLETIPPTPINMLQWVFGPKIYNYRFDMHKVTPDDISACIASAMKTSNMNYSGVNTIMDFRYGGYIQTAVENVGFYQYSELNYNNITIRSIPQYSPVVSFSVENFTSNPDNLITKIPSVIGFNDNGNCNNIEFVSRHYSQLANDGLYRPDYVNGSLNLIYSEPIDVTRINNSTFVTGKVMADKSVSVAGKASEDFSQHHGLWEGFVATEKTNKAR